MTNICQPTKIICVGLNYFGHAKETGAEVPKEPVIFGKFNDTLMPHMADIELPPQHRCYDYEAELVIVIGREAWNIKCEEAHDYIYGYTCGNDLSARDCQFRSSQAYRKVAARLGSRGAGDSSGLDVQAGGRTPYYMQGKRGHNAGRQHCRYDFYLR
jgi:2-keto-4-pentenoate hydratase/2-oxohepta-3-ene-1,7-dioic acid hydratase in catechol pathway